MIELSKLIPYQNHELLQPNNSKILQSIIREQTPNFETLEKNTIKSLLFTNEWRQHILALNSVPVWTATNNSLQQRSLFTSIDLSKINEKPVNEISRTLTSGIILGRSVIEVLLDKFGESPILQATVESLQHFPNNLNSMEELLERSSAVMGTIDSTGSFETALNTLNTPIMYGQDVFTDLLRIYSTDLIERYTI
jgi:hypothetical protein